MTEYITQEQVDAMLYRHGLDSEPHDFVRDIEAAAIQHYRDSLVAGVELPPMPECDAYCGDCNSGEQMWSEQQIEDYARQAIADALAKQVPLLQVSIKEFVKMAEKEVTGTPTYYAVWPASAILETRPMTAHTINTDEATAVANEVYLESMDTCPVGVKVQLENAGGVLVYGMWDGKPHHWKSWAPLPRRRKPDAET